MCAFDCLFFSLLCLLRVLVLLVVLFLLLLFAFLLLAFFLLAFLLLFGLVRLPFGFTKRKLPLCEQVESGIRGEKK